MTTIANQFGMKEALAQLGMDIMKVYFNRFKSFFSWRNLESYSPVDGQLIAKVRTTTARLRK
jgi:aldehyde dehydrogenase (NAD+)